MYYLKQDEHQDNQHSKTMYKSSETLWDDKDDSLSTMMSAKANGNSVTNQHQSNTYHKLSSFNSNKYSTFDNLPGYLFF